MTGSQLAAQKAHQKNIERYRRVLRTNLSDLEKAFVKRRLYEERQALQTLSGQLLQNAGMNEGTGIKAD